MNDGETWVPIAMLAGGGVVALLLMWTWWSSLRFCRLLKDLPTVRVRGIFVGLVETTGTVKCDEPVFGGISGIRCVHHRWSVAEHWRRVRTYTDSKGKTRTTVDTGTDVVADGGGSVPFNLVDESGSIGVLPNGADWRERTTVNQTVDRSHALYHTKAPDVTVSGSTGERTFTEDVVAVDDKIYLVGTAAVSSEGSTLQLIRDRAEDDMLIISTAPEKQVARGRFWGAAFAYVFGLLFAALGGVGALGMSVSRQRGMAHPEEVWIQGSIVGASVFILLAFVLWLVMVRNGVVRVRTRWQRAVSLVDVQLKRRADLIPNLTAVTKGMAVHERSTQEAVAKLRAGAAAGATMMALAEAYPELKSDGAFMKLQNELSATEDRIAIARSFEIESRAAFLERLRTFPDGPIARVLGVSAPPPELGLEGRSAADLAAQVTPSVNP